MPSPQCLWPSCLSSRSSALSISGQRPRGTFCSGPSVHPFLSLVPPTQRESHCPSAFPCPSGACPIRGPAPWLATPAAALFPSCPGALPLLLPRRPCQGPFVCECQPDSWGQWGQASLPSPWVRPQNIAVFPHALFLDCIYSCLSSLSGNPHKHSS